MGTCHSSRDPQHASGSADSRKIKGEVWETKTETRVGAVPFPAWPALGGPRCSRISKHSPEGGERGESGETAGGRALKEPLPSCPAHQQQTEETPVSCFQPASKLASRMSRAASWKNVGLQEEEKRRRFNDQETKSEPPRMFSSENLWFCWQGQNTG